MDNYNSFKSFECPCCGADMNITQDMKYFKCEYCDKMLYISKSRSGETTVKSRNKQIRLQLISIIIVIILLMIIKACASVFEMTSRSSSVTTEVQKSTPEIDPFENIEIRIEGDAPFASVKRVNNTETELRDVQYQLSKSKNLSNGDIIVITATDKANYVWTRNTLEYTVSGLMTVVTDSDMISASDISDIHDMSVNELQLSWIKNLNVDSFDDLSDLNMTFTPYNIYINCLNDPSLGYLYSQSILYDAYEVTFNCDGKDFVIYQYVSYSDPMINPSDNSLSIDYSSCYADNGFLPADDLRINSELITKFDYLDGFNNVKKMESYMKKDDYTLVR